MYQEYEEFLNGLKSVASEEDFENSDFLVNVRNDIKGIYNRIDPSIRMDLQKKGITFVKNIYTGFDTEYYKKSKSRNELLSVQLTVSTRVILQVPFHTDYKLTVVDPQTSKRRDVPKIRGILRNNIESDIETLIKNIRFMKSGVYDASVRIISRFLRNQDIKSIKNLDKGVESFIFDKKGLVS